MLKIAFLAFLFLSLIDSYAQDVLETIEVKADKELSTFNFAPSEKITKTALEKNGSLLGTKFENTNGLVTTQGGGPGGRISFFLRGTESRHVSFTLDGLKLNDPSNTDRQFDSAFLTSHFLSDAIIHKGPQPVLLGSDAIGGAVELKTRKGRNAPETRASLSGGSFGTIDGSLSTDWKSNSSNGTLTVTQFHTDGISRLNKKRFDAEERDAADITQIVSSSEHRWNQKIQTDFLVSILRGKNELDGATDDNSNDESTNDQYLVQQKTSLEIRKNQAFSLRNGINRHQRNIQTLVVGEESYGGTLYQNEALYRIDFEPFKLLGGISSEHEDFSQGDRSSDLHSVFMQGALELGNLSFQSGFRTEKHTRYGTFHTGSTGISYRQYSHKFSIQYSQGFKAPSLYQLYGPPIFGFNVGNRNLVPEANHSWEASWLNKNEEWESELTLFQNRLSNLIAFTNSGYINQKRFVSEGMDLAAKYKLRKLHLSSGVTHQNFRKEESAVLRRPNNIFRFGAAYFPTEITEVSLVSRWFSARKDVDENLKSVKLNPYEVVDAGLKVVFEKSDYGIQIKNIFNREYEDLHGFNVMPRSLFLHTGFIF